jgi:hypothetical protein
MAFSQYVEPINTQLAFISSGKFEDGTNTQTRDDLLAIVAGLNTVKLGDSASLDSFSRLRVSEPRPVGDYNLSYGLEPLIMEAIVSGAGNTVTHEANTLMGKLTLGGANVGHSRIQSYRYHYYQPGRSHAVFATGVLGAAVANTVKRIGYFDAANGVFLQQDADGTIRFTLRTSTSGSVSDANTVTSANWSDQPGWTIDPTKSIIIVFDLQFLGMGRVRCYEDRDGKLVKLHEFKNAQNLAVPYMQTATLPVRAEVVQTTTAAAATMYFKCASVMTEGGTDDAAGFPFSRASGSITAASGARTHALSIQPALTYNSLANRMTVEIDSLDVVVTGSNPVLWELCVGDVLTGTTTFNDVNGTYSGMQYNTAGTTSGTPAVVLASGYTSATTQSRSVTSRRFVTRYPITLDAAGAARANGRLTVLLTGLGGSSATQVALNWKELR